MIEKSTSKSIDENTQKIKENISIEFSVLDIGENH